jgi:hypothetical protein
LLQLHEKASRDQNVAHSSSQFVSGVFDCKPLAFLWAKFPEHYGPHNTIMIDDLRRSELAQWQQVDRPGV